MSQTHYRRFPLPQSEMVQCSASVGIRGWLTGRLQNLVVTRAQNTGSRMSAFWACARIEREKTAMHFLQLAGYQTYFPQLRTTRRRLGRNVEVCAPLFPCYGFVLIELQWHRVNGTPGVHELIMDGGGPAKVPDRIISDIRKREVNGVVELPKRGLKYGDKVKIVRGPLSGRVALYDDMAPQERIFVLLSVLGAERRITLAKDAIEPA
jgi:transcriptional antiterminator RfaH